VPKWVLRVPSMELSLSNSLIFPWLPFPGPKSHHAHGIEHRQSRLGCPARVRRPLQGIHHAATGLRTRWVEDDRVLLGRPSASGDSIPSPREINPSKVFVFTRIPFLWRLPPSRTGRRGIDRSRGKLIWTADLEQGEFGLNPGPVGRPRGILEQRPDTERRTTGNRGAGRSPSSSRFRSGCVAKDGVRTPGAAPGFAGVLALCRVVVLNPPAPEPGRATPTAQSGEDGHFGQGQGTGTGAPWAFDPLEPGMGSRVQSEARPTPAGLLPCLSRTPLDRSAGRTMLVDGSGSAACEC
jgi:hypothetical protein